MKARVTIAWLVGCLAFGLACGEARPPEATQPAQAAAPPAAEASARGLVKTSARASPGYVLFSPLLSNVTYLIDNEGRVVHLWKAVTSPGGDQILQADGSLLRLGRDLDFEHFRTGGVGGWIERLAWDGEELWAWNFASERAVLHHDIEPLPKGNVLALAWEAKTPTQAARAGRRADRIPKQGLWPDFVLEVKPEPPRGGTIVWEWHVWDHLVQGLDATGDTYGEPSANPGKLDINADAPKPTVTEQELAQLKALGYVPDDAKAEDLESDFLHINAIDYHAGLDQIALSVPNLGELWILDHGTTRAEAAASRGGQRGRGGEILYRWGNPSAYGRGAAAERVLGAQHDAHWIPEGLRGAGHLMIFNNDAGGQSGKWSSVEEIAPPLLASGLYALADGKPYAPRAAAWRYVGEPRASFYAEFISGAQRTKNGNTLICSGPQGRLFEVTPSGEIAWEFLNPYSGSVLLADGTRPQPVPENQPYAVFRAARIPPDHPGIRGRRLVPLDPQPELAPRAE
ncbi:MAG: aryl-sulfate sulfotransferase [Myxococcota bacterium]|jgi:hypothetical protein